MNERNLGIPVDFDWKVYVSSYKDLQQADQLH